jgi:hypothetical protein
MPKINPDGTITIPRGIVRNMSGRPGDEIVFEERIIPSGIGISEITVLLRSVWQEHLKDRAEPLYRI